VKFLFHGSRTTVREREGPRDPERENMFSISGKL